MAPETDVRKWPSIASIAVCFAIAILLFTFPRFLAITPEAKPVVSTQAIDYRGLQEIGISTVGLYFFFRGISDSAYWITFYSSLKSYGYRSTPFTASDYSNMVGTGIDLVLGLVATFGSRALVRFLNWSRGLGTTS